MEAFEDLDVSKNLLDDLCDSVVLCLDNLTIGKVVRIATFIWPPLQRLVSVQQLSLFLVSKELPVQHILRSLPQNELYTLQKEFIDKCECVEFGEKVSNYDDVLAFLESNYTDVVTPFKLSVYELKAVEKAEIPKLEPKKINEMRKKAIQNASEWNTEMNRNKRTDRTSFFEHHTMIIQKPKTKIPASTKTNFGAYPVAVVPGQYQNYYRRYTPNELYRLPVNTVLDGEIYRPLKKCPSPEPITVTAADFQKGQDQNVKSSSNSKSSRRNSRSNLSMAPSSVDSKIDANENCAFCCEDIKNDDKFVQCSKCGSCGHPDCMDMSDEMFTVIQFYPWMCMECKPCSICSRLDCEEKMLFCDRCDRGYHTFCVGLKELPSGEWWCPKFCLQFSKNATDNSVKENKGKIGMTEEPTNFSCLSTTLAPHSDEKRKRKILDNNGAEDGTPTRRRR